MSLELVAERVGLEHGNRVHQPHGREEGKEGAQHDEPGSRAAFRVRLLKRGVREGRLVLFEVVFAVAIVGSIAAAAGVARFEVVLAILLGELRVGLLVDDAGVDLLNIHCVRIYKE